MQDEWDHEESNNSLDLIILTYEISSAKQINRKEMTHQSWRDSSGMGITF